MTESLHTSLLRLCALALVTAMTACGDDVPPSDPGETGVQLNEDAGTEPRPVVCQSDEDCDDGTFCNGLEGCAVGAAESDARGCVGGLSPCLGTQRCQEGPERCFTECEMERDADQDGQDAIECGGNDCDDGNAGRYPGNEEQCDEGHLDEDCNLTTFGEVDGDADGFFRATCCNFGDGELTFCGDDCADDVANVHPDANEVCDGVDNDCDGMHDEGVSVTGYLDTDYDLHGDPEHPMVECAEETRFAVEGDDCDDREPTVHGAQAELCDGIDNDCDSDVDEDAGPVTWYRDGDGDGFGDADDTESSCAPLDGYSILAGDCDDARADVNRVATELCDGADNDCDDEVDEGQATSGFVDGDGDGFGGAEASGCPGIGGFVLEGEDCDDASPTVYPGRIERCDDVDEDCDGHTDEGMLVAGFADLDHDLRGDPDAPLEACAHAPGFVMSDDDCDDSNPAVHGQQAEICDAIDNDCDEDIDEQAGPATWYSDTDGDGFGDPAGPTRQACSAPAGHSILPFDCDDEDAEAFPGAEEDCDGRDTDCNGVADFALSPGDFEDDDGDARADAACAGGDDCDDDDGASFPGAPELCDLRDNDCDAEADEEAGELVWYRDLDRDGFGDDDAAAVASCEPLVGRVARGGDCDDSNPAVRPGTSDDCDGIDRDCDGELDEDAGRRRYYADLDGDGSAGSTFVVACESPGGSHSLVSADCDDDDTDRKPGAREACDGQDDDCDGAVDEGARLSGYADVDGDLHGDPATPLTSCAGSAGFSQLSDDCDDADVAVHGAQLEVCDSRDNDCDETTDEGTQSVAWYADADGDGFGSALSGTTVSCTPVAGHVLVATDCDDANEAVNRAADETCDGRDDDCDGAVDEGLQGLATEACDGMRDEDCDGEIDEGCACALGTARLCGEPAPGECSLGVQACNAQGEWGRCVGGRSPASEVCDALDNDCDGASDEDEACQPVVVEQNVGAGFELAVAPADSDNNAFCETFNASFLGDPALAAALNAPRPSLDMALYTVYRRASSQTAGPSPLIVWGNGTCAHVDMYDALLRHLASQGFFVVAPHSRMTASTGVIDGALDFAFAANQDPTSPYYQRIDTEHTGAAGHGQGVAAIPSGDPRVRAVLGFTAIPSNARPYLVISGDRDVGTSPTQLADAVAAAPRPAAYYYYGIAGTGLYDGYNLVLVDPARVLEPATAWFQWTLRDDDAARTWLLTGACDACGDFLTGNNGL